ncbi:MAG: glycerophosphodiester phosphodiesterase [Myxococcota bacterium]
MHPYLSAPTPHLFGHRGASGECPENTLPSFRRAVEGGVGFLETDCHATSDGEIVLLHDGDLSRTTNGEGPVREARFAELERLDAGYHFTPDRGATFPYRGSGVRIPRLRELLEAFPALRVNLEIKQAEPPIVDRVLDELRAARALDRVLLAAEDDGVMAKIRAADPGTALGSSLADVVAFYRALAEDRIASFEPAGDALQVPPSFGGDPLVTPEAVAAAHACGLRVHVWTLNDPKEIRRVLSLGVDGVMSDFPARLVQISRSL